MKQVSKRIDFSLKLNSFCNILDQSVVESYVTKFLENWFQLRSQVYSILLICALDNEKTIKKSIQGAV